MARRRIFVLPPGDLVIEGRDAYDEMTDWHVPETSLTRMRSILRDEIALFATTDPARARSSLGKLLEEQD